MDIEALGASKRFTKEEVTRLNARMDAQSSTLEQITNQIENNMPYKIADASTGKTYRYGRRFKNGGMQKIWEEVL